MEGIGLGDPARELLGRGVRHVHLLRLSQALRVRLRDLFDLHLVREGLENPFAKDVVELVRVHADGLQVHRGATGLRFEIPEGVDDLLAARAV